MLARALLALSLRSTSGAVAAPLASAFGPRPMGGASAGYVGRLKVTPEHAPSGTLLTVTAGGTSRSRHEFDLVWRTADRQLEGR